MLTSGGTLQLLSSLKNKQCPKQMAKFGKWHSVMNF